MNDMSLKGIADRNKPHRFSAQAQMSLQPRDRHLWLGAIFPAVVILIELVSRVCANGIFDPMPTAGHALIVAFVPLMNFIVWSRLASASASETRWLMTGIGAAVMISACYCLLFLPILPLALVAIIAFGIGLLPFGPLAAFVSSFNLLVAINGSDRARNLHRFGLAGFLLGLIGLVAIETPMVATRIGVQWAGSADPAKRERGVTLLRTFGDDDLLLRLCYGMMTRPAGPLGLLMLMANSSQNGNVWFFEPRQREILAPQAQARELYYRVHGVAFNQVPPPNVARHQHGLMDELQFDGDHGAADVGGRIKGLSLRQSRIDGSISGDDHVAYLEWTFELHNVSLLDREGRLEIALPPGSVVSRASLWINGEEKEAAYGGRGEVRAAYQKVAVQQRRDPLLVTTKGADRVLAQAFPVPRNGGSIKFKLGITAPLEIIDAKRQRLVLPAIFDRNFSLNADFGHDIWIEGRHMTSPAGTLSRAEGPNGIHRFSGRLTDQNLTRPRPAITIGRSPSETPRVARIGDSAVITQTVSTETKAPVAMIIVIDGSARLAGKTGEIDESLSGIPDGTRVGIMIAGEPLVSLPIVAWNAAAKASARRALQRHSFTGGHDNTAALAAALLALESEPQANLLWIHGPQPLAFNGSATRLAQTVARLSRLPELTLYPVVAGPNMALPDVPWTWSARLLPNVGSLPSDLSDAVRQLATGHRTTIERREVSDFGSTTEAVKGSEHIVRLWTRDRILDMMRNAGSRNTEATRLAAVALATDRQLVTPVSGAVVLETKQQYDENRLTPVTQASVPTLPEPHEWALICIAGLAMLWLLGRRGRAGRNFGNAA